MEETIILLAMPFIPFLILFALFLLCAKIERRSLLCGILFVLAGFALVLGTIICYAILYRLQGDSPVFRLVKGITPFVITAVGLLPTIMVLATLAAGIMNLLQYGLHLRNTFAVVFSAAVIVYTVLWPMVGNLRIGAVSSMLYLYITLIFLYSIMLKTVLTVTSMINLFHIRKNHGLNYVVALGRPFRNEKIKKMVFDRVDTAIGVYRNNPGSKLVLSGGWRKYQVEPECRLMADYALSQGVPQADILLEDAGDSTIAMVKNSYALMCEDYPSGEGEKPPQFAVASTGYHVLRALFIARKNKIKCIGYGARTKLHISMNAFVREYVQYLKLTRRFHLVLLIVFTIVYWGGNLILIQSGILSPRMWQPV